MNFGHGPDKVSMRVAIGSRTGVQTLKAVLNAYAELIHTQCYINQVLTKVDYAKQLT